MKSSIRGFFAFMNERHNIYLRRQNGNAYPWTRDKILRDYKFTNVFRELDTGTIHCRKAIREPYADHPELFFNIASYRLYNLIGTQKRLGYIDEWNSDKYVKIIRNMKKNGEQIFTGAHMITGTLGGDKIHQVFELCTTELWKNRRKLEPNKNDTLQSAFNKLSKQSPGFGPFIAYEVISDLRWTRYLNHASDILSWANPGPGAMRGINRILGYDVKPTKQLSTENYIDGMRQLLELSERYVLFHSSLEMREIEHTLCEYDKYERVRLGQGKPRSRYVPPNS